MRLALVLLLLIASGPVAVARQIVDLAGRTVTVPARVERIILGEGRYVPALAILDREDPVGRLVGMMGDYEQVDPATYARFRERFPRLADIPRFGRSAQETFSLERALALRADLAIFGTDGHGPDARNASVIAALEKAGTTVIFIDFRNAPLTNTPRSMEILGAALGREAQAAAFLDEWHAALDTVRSRIAQDRPAAPRVFVESRVGLMPCCETMTHGMIGELVTIAGGTNLAADVVPGVAGTVSLEYLLTHQPDIYIGTAIGGASTSGRDGWISLGPDVTPEIARETLRRSMLRVGMPELAAVRNGRAYGIWHHFYNSPFNVAALQAVAKWLHPRLFADLDPEALLAGWHDRFQPFPMTGAYWVALDERP